MLLPKQGSRCRLARVFCGGVLVQSAAVWAPWPGFVLMVQFFGSLITYRAVVVVLPDTVLCRTGVAGISGAEACGCICDVVGYCSKLPHGEQLVGWSFCVLWLTFLRITSGFLGGYMGHMAALRGWPVAVALVMPLVMQQHWRCGDQVWGGFFMVLSLTSRAILVSTTAPVPAMRFSGFFSVRRR